MTDRELFIKALDALEWNLPVIQDYGDKEQLNIQNNAITILRDRLEQPEPVTGNLLKDAYNAMVEKKTRSQKLREAGFTRRPKGWEKEKDEQEPVAHTLNCVCGAVWDIKNDGSEEMVHAPDTFPPQRPWVGLTDEEIHDAFQNSSRRSIYKVIEFKLKEKNT